MKRVVKWRYRVIHVGNHDFEKSLAAEQTWLCNLGKDGWELVAVIPGKGLTNAWVHLYFKKKA